MDFILCIIIGIGRKKATSLFYWQISGGGIGKPVYSRNTQHGFPDSGY